MKTSNPIILIIFAFILKSNDISSIDSKVIRRNVSAETIMKLPRKEKQQNKKVHPKTLLPSFLMK